jgi:hypothetical protein
MARPRIHTCDFYLGSDVFTLAELEEICASPNITYGDANRTLIKVSRLREVFDVVPEGIEFLDPDTYIDLEN